MESIISTIIVCAVIAVICVIGVLKYIKNLKSGCCGTGGDSIKKVKPQDSNVNNYSFENKNRRYDLQKLRNASGKCF